ncbi:MAG: hypothetical protein ABSH12_05440, partial [Endomicrobiales bacterium]
MNNSPVSRHSSRLVRRATVIARRTLRHIGLIRPVAIITLCCFLLTSVVGQSVSALVEDHQTIAQFHQMFEGLLIPASIGRITEGCYFGSKDVVINIQDLHCNPEVQKNISKILGVFDTKYRINNVYLEGAIGKVDTSWLGAVSDKRVRQNMLDSLINSGKLTGTEYYAAISGKKDLIRGIEDPALYKANLVRLQQMMDNERKIDTLIDGVSSDLNSLKDAYLSRGNRRLEQKTADSVKAGTAPREYYRFLSKMAEKNEINFSSFKNLAAYQRMIDGESGFNYSEISREMQEFVMVLKRQLPYSAFKYLSDKTDNFTRLDEMYLYLSRIAGEYNLNLAVNFPKLQQFFDYVNLTQSVNPLTLIKEESMLVRDLKDILAESQSERDVIFLCNFFRLYGDFLKNKITLDDYKYFQANYSRFELLFDKYVDGKRLEAFAPYFNSMKTFYQVNEERNHIFMRNTVGEQPSAAPAVEKVETAAEREKIISSLDTGRIFLTVTGGFHTRGYTELLKAQKISYIIVTPNVTHENAIAEAVYPSLIEKQGKFLAQTLAALALSLNPDNMRIQEVIGQYIVSQAGKNSENISRVASDIQGMLDKITSNPAGYQTQLHQAYPDIFPNEAVPTSLTIDNLHKDETGFHYTLINKTAGTEQTFHLSDDGTPVLEGETAVPAIAKKSGIAQLIGKWKLSYARSKKFHVTPGKGGNGVAPETETIGNTKTEPVIAVKKSILPAVMAVSAIVLIAGTAAALLVGFNALVLGLAAGLIGVLVATLIKKIAGNRANFVGNVVAAAPVLFAGGLLFMHMPIVLGVMAIGWILGSLLPRALSTGQKNSWQKYQDVVSAPETAESQVKEAAEKTVQETAENPQDAIAAIGAEVLPLLTAREKAVFEKLDWSQVYNSLERKNRNTYSDRKYGRFMAKFEPGEMTHGVIAAVRGKAKEQKNGLRGLASTLIIGLIGGTVIQLFNGFFLRYYGSTFQYYYLNRSKTSYLTKQEIIHAVIDELGSQTRSVHPFEGFWSKVNQSASSPSQTGIKRIVGWAVYVPSFIMTAVFSLLSASATKGSTSLGSVPVLRHATDLVMVISELVFITPLLRFMKDRGKLYLVSTVVVGSVLNVITTHPLLIIPLALLYVWKVSSWQKSIGKSGDKNEYNSQADHRKRSIFGLFAWIIIPGIILTLVFPMAPLFAMIAHHAVTQTVPVFVALISSVTLHGLIRPFATVFIRRMNATYHQKVSARLALSFAAQIQSEETQQWLSVNELKNSSNETAGIEINLKNAAGETVLQIPWGYSAQELQSMLETLKNFEPQPDDAANFELLKTAIVSYLAAVMDYNDTIKGQPINTIFNFMSLGFMFSDTAIVTGSNIQKDRIRELLNEIVPQGPPTRDEATLAGIRDAVRTATAQAPADVMTHRSFWKGVMTGWFTMWFIATEIAVALGDMGVFDFVLGKITGHSDIHFFSQIGLLIEGANAQHPIANSGNVFFNWNSGIGTFVLRGGMLGAFNNLVNDLSATSHLVTHGESPFSAWHQVQQNNTNTILAQREMLAMESGKPMETPQQTLLQKAA